MTLFPSDHPLTRALTERSYTDLTSVQSAVLDPRATDRDLLVSAQTGSGKTVAYGLAMAATLLGEASELEPAGEPLALVIAPTRELALQVHAELGWLYRHAVGQVVACVGGMDPRAEARLLARGAHIVVGTPGRLRDHIERGALRTGSLRVAVLDEADEMLDMGFREDLEFILEATPQDRRTLLFSATLPHEIVAMAKRYQRDAWRIALTSGPQGHADIDYRAVRVAPTEVEHAVVNLLRWFDSPTAMVFCGTRESVRHLQASLLERGFGVVALSGELSQNERNHTLQALRDGRARVCVATDVAARGIDLPSLDLVIHAELPRTAETLQHRSGRTGRAGRKGTSVLLVPMSRRRRAEGLIQAAGIKVQWSGPPSAEDIARQDQQRLLDLPLLNEDIAEDDQGTIAALLENRSAEQIAAALLRLYRSQLPAAEEVFDPGQSVPVRTAGEPGPPRGDRENRPSVWFRLNIGRMKNADPRWLIPLICRQGKITKQEIGAIRIMDRETRFEIDAGVADRFLAATRQVERPEGRIEPLADAHAPPPTEPRTHAPAAKPKDKKKPKPHRKGKSKHGGV
ncbi:MAG: DEAD/DEAH box helicase [Actinomycetota bacterium]